MAKTKIKLASITNLSDARWAAAENIEYSGYNFDSSNNFFIPPVKAKEIIDWTSGSSIVAEFGSTNTLNEIMLIAELINADIVEISNLQYQSNKHIRLSKPIIIDIGIDELKTISIEDFINDDNVYALKIFGKNENSDIDLLKNVCKKIKVFWDLPFDKNQLQNIIAQYHPYAINIVSGKEEKAGLKDFDELTEIFEIIKNENNNL